MLIKYYKPRKPTVKGPVIYLDKNSNSYRFVLDECTEVPDAVGHEILAKMPDIMCKEEKKATRKKASKKAKPAPVNKMAPESPEEK